MHCDRSQGTRRISIRSLAALSNRAPMKVRINMQPCINGFIHSGDCLDVVTFGNTYTHKDAQMNAQTHISTLRTIYSILD